MTVAPTGGGGALANPDEIETGLDDFGMEDAVIPRLAIVHKDAQFKDSLSGETFDSVKTILLGLVKQRILWHTTVDDDDWPMCRSVDHEHGFPNESEDQPKDKRFPWELSGFRPEDYPADSGGQRKLPCSGCALKEWGSHPDGKRPYCSEQFTMPVLYDPQDNGLWVPAIMTFQKTGLKPLKSYLTSFARNRTPAFSAITEIGLDPRQRGATDYAVPTFRRVGDTEEENWRDYSVNYRTMRDFLQEEPGTKTEDVEVSTPSPNVNKAPESKTETKAEEPVEAEVVEESKAEEQVNPAPDADAPHEDTAPKSEAAAADDDDDLPF
jgi:hypothetical protein